uniref:Si:ch211-215k15.4 n=1 Tax=Sparus aurata TaxID=8175 RepID=A0A671XQ11_SPAAU
MSNVIVVLMKLFYFSSDVPKPMSVVEWKAVINWLQGSCTHTQGDKNPWWRLDLLKPYKVNTVTITNRKDCCHKRINGAEIRIGNSLYMKLVCAVITSILAGESKTYECRGMEGRYVNIVIPGRREALTLCEVEIVFLCPVINIAKGGKVAQSSLAWKGVPERAIDGSRASNWLQGSCTHTQGDKNPWWRLDLLKPYKVNTVTITNRKDCCHKRINGAEIRIGNSRVNNGNANPRCAVITSILAGESKTYECRGMEGRYVNIVIPGRREALTLCEVEVTGQPSGKIAPNGDLQHMVRASNWLQGSCTHTQGDKNPWWRLDLLKPYKVNTVTITNRKDCCHKRINGAEIRIGNSRVNNGNANPR